MIYKETLCIPPPKPGLKPRDICIQFDLDDTLWPLVPRAIAGTGVNYEAITNFFIPDVPTISEAQCSQIYQNFANPEYFRDIEFDPAISEIEKLHQLGVKIGIKTRSITQAIIDTKKPQLIAAFPYLRDEDMTFDLTESHSGKHGKILPDNVTFFVDDSPYNILTSTAYVNFLPRTPWNAPETEQDRMRAGEKDFYVMENLGLIIETIYRSIRSWLR